MFSPHFLQSLAKERDYSEVPDDLLDIGERSGLDLLFLKVLSASVIRQVMNRGGMTTKKKEIGVGPGFPLSTSLLTSPADKTCSGAGYLKGSLLQNFKIWVRVKRSCSFCVGVSAKEIYCPSGILAKGLRRVRQDEVQSGKPMLGCAVPKDAWMPLVEIREDVHGVEQVDLVAISDFNKLLSADIRHRYICGPVNSNFKQASASCDM